MNEVRLTYVNLKNINMIKVGIIGAGNIGSELQKRIVQLGWNIFFVAKQDGIYVNDKKVDELKNIKKYAKINLAFLAIPTFDDGLTAFNYIKLFLENKIPIVTCEKGALGNYFNELGECLPLIGYSATVGGGTRILNYARQRITKNTKTINTILNGTLNYVFSQIGLGKSMKDIVKEVRDLKYSEPGVNNAIDIINKEATGDVLLKISIFLNVLGLAEKPIKAKDILANKVSEQEIEMMEKTRDFKYFITLSKEKVNDQNIGGFNLKFGDWFCSGGFRKVTEGFLKSVDGVNNGIEIIENGLDGIYRLIGPGAGPGATVSSMIKDAQIFLGQVNIC